jgi:hypothetical protein
MGPLPYASVTRLLNDTVARAGFLDGRRTLRPETECREPTEAEWHEFERHFEQRKLELGSCGRPYGSPCSHEHACIRCPMLRVDPPQRIRLVDIIRNLSDRIVEARSHGWHGEVTGLQISPTAARNKLANLERAHVRTADLGMPRSARDPLADRPDRPGEQEGPRQ